MLKKVLVLILFSVVSNPIFSIDDKQSSYYFRNETLKFALTKYAKMNGFNIKFDNISDATLNKLINGKITVSNETDLLNNLSNQYGFEWFINSGVLYISSNENISKSIYVSPENMPNIKAVLQQTGTLNPRFGYSELPAENKIIVTGPTSYINAVVNQIKQLKVSPVDSQFAVYRLKYASATDKQLSFNNRVVVIPGVATILQNLLQLNNLTSKQNLSNEVSEPIKNEVMKLKNNPPTDAKNSNGGSLTSNVQIQADNRLNTIIIRDKKSNLNVYKNLIQLLDVPSPLIQVDVLIIHLDKDRLDENGINWWASSSQGFKGGFGANNLTSNPTNNLSFYYGQINSGQLLVSNLNNFAVSLQMLEQNRIAKAVGKPSIATIDNIPAIINVTENVYINAPQSSSSNNSSSGNNGNQTSYNQIGITTSLEITPHVIDEDGERNIKLSIVLQDGSINDPTSNVLSSTLQSNINSEAYLKEGQSILLAGYSKSSVEKVTKKVPFLGDIPILGWFFSTKSNTQKQIETLYLVTPKIIWENNKYKLSNYIEVGAEKFDIKQNINLVPKNISTNKVINNGTKSR